MIVHDLFDIADLNLDYFVVGPGIIQVNPFGFGDDTITVTFVSDGILESDETFALELEDNLGVEEFPPTGPGVFYRRILQFTIIDADGKTDRLPLQDTVMSSCNSSSLHGRVQC